MIFQHEELHVYLGYADQSTWWTFEPVRPQFLRDEDTTLSKLLRAKELEPFPGYIWYVWTVNPICSEIQFPQDFPPGGEPQLKVQYLQFMWYISCEYMNICAHLQQDRTSQTDPSITNLDLNMQFGKLVLSVTDDVDSTCTYCFLVCLQEPCSKITEPKMGILKHPMEPNTHRKYTSFYSFATSRVVLWCSGVSERA